MRKIILWVLLLTPIISLSQSISNGEYFFGYDTAIKYPITIDTPSDSVELSLNLEIPQNLPNGFNAIYFNFNDTNNEQSFLYKRTFYKHTSNNTIIPLSYAEYFIDNDPGFNEGDQIQIENPSDSITLTFNVDLDGLEEGFHTLYIRTRNINGQWGNTLKRYFFINKTGNPTISNIVEIKYYYVNQNYSSDTFSFSIDPPSPNVDLDFIGDISTLPPNEIYDMFISAVNEDGVESIIEKREIKACGIDPPTANFDYIGFGNNISLIDESQFAESYIWDFGDGNSDTISNPSHQYVGFGSFDVTLVVSNFCESDTVSSQVNIAGLNGLSVSEGGNYGDVSMEVYGGGFNAQANFILNKLGEIIIPDTIIIIDSNRAYLRFDLRNKELGVYDLILTQGNIQDQLNSAFTIIEENQGPRFSLNVSGRTTIRSGRSEPITISYSNNSPVDAIAVPLFIILKGDTTVNIDFDFDLIEPSVDEIDYSQILPYFNTDTLYGQPQEAIVLPLMIPYILASQQEELTFFIEAENDIEIEVWLGDSFYNSPLSNDIVSCAEGLIGFATEFVFPSNNPFTGCLSSVIDNSFSIYKNIHSSNSGFINNVKLFGSILWNLTKIAEGCSGLLPQSTLARIAKKSIITLLDIKAGIFFENAYNLSKCKDVFFGSDNTTNTIGINVVNSFDPNEKTGPSNASDNNYIQSISPYNYIVYFENVDTASAAAQEVIIIDTLDTIVFDLESFELGSITIGDDFSINPPPGLKEYSTQVDLNPNINLIVRIDAKLDTTEGIVRWRFLSLDPVSLELTNDPFLGFLPPNLSPREGEGSVSFRIELKPEVVTGDSIRNNAEIIFDTNDPIVTNVHLNVIDDIPPNSSVSELLPIQNDSTFLVSWEGTDVESEVRAYDIYTSIDSDTFQIWLYDTDLLQAPFLGKQGVNYSFYSIAKDFAGNIEPGKTEADAMTLVTSTSDINETENQQPVDILVYPNPTSDYLYISTRYTSLVGTQLEIFNTLGISLKSINIDDNNQRIDLNNFPKGQYILRFISNNIQFSKLIIIN